MAPMASETESACSFFCPRFSCLELFPANHASLLGEVGRGGMGVIYKARQISLNRLVALKMILAGGHAGATERARFRKEAEAVARLQHPNIVQIHEIGEHDGLPYLALEWVEGISLAQKLLAATFSVRETAGLVCTLAHAIHAAHQRGIVHRDLKPGNVLLQASDETGATGAVSPLVPHPSPLAPHLSPLAPHLSPLVPKITDFGLAKRLDDAATRTQSGAVVGTPSYMSPEQAAGSTRLIGPATDVYALGVILYEMLTGVKPFRGDSTLEVIKQVLSEEPVPLRRLRPALPRDFETICLRCMHKDRERRYPSALTLAEDLERFLAGEPVRARPAGHVERAVKWDGASPRQPLCRRQVSWRWPVWPFWESGTPRSWSGRQVISTRKHENKAKRFASFFMTPTSGRLIRIGNSVSAARPRAARSS